ncbi:exonuclease [Halopseudomonas pelagia]|uniref:Exonuclease n=2 Tax=Halopseudomonas pelagia TaxID=553151 RepID=A0AA91U1N7_9GAMM|nr:exonuclease [Halopseudomonas pelagia]QFY57642.1 exonuclease [Halopseudomonas pelagia]
MGRNMQLEATCWENQTTPDKEAQSIDNMEIIELGCALTTRAGRILDTRSFLVKPERYSTLSSFCTELTGITQSMVDTALTFPEAIQKLNFWLGQPTKDFIWCSWGNYDLKHLTAQNDRSGPEAFILNYPHLNLKRLWRRTTGQRKKTGLTNAMAFHDLVFEGNHHRGVDDARNISRLLPFMDWSLEEELLTLPKPALKEYQSPQP